MSKNLFIYYLSPFLITIVLLAEEILFLALFFDFPIFYFEESKSFISSRFDFSRDMAYRDAVILRVIPVLAVWARVEITLEDL